ncbi:ABC transporter ATP-binding protein [Tumebacillus sp. DT12]|uniref:ABC transporter ATP-binding protein n=1 Tax=Tumebacillus lacus TaxID=2995335 RepID=A0ABT3X119_9BACL|nr:ABC transporter ATP-binding protein [Tumebacillus lacus]MCX7570609.1 ABC transporter ATP-binding protein [Tumebacillus lacus]
MIVAEGVQKSFQGRTILSDMSFGVKEGEIVGLLGPNGAGKTTTVRLLNGVIRPDAGTIRVGGLDPVTEGDPVRAMSGILTEGAGLYHEMSAVENLRFFAKLYGVKRADSRIHDLLRQFDLQAHRDKAVGQFSTGMKKRLGLAKALLHEPKLLFLDEPTNGLDPDGIREVMGYLKELNREFGTTILLCSHVLHQIEEVCTRYVFLDGGRVIEDGTLAEIEAKYLRTVTLRVETDLIVAGGQYAGYEAVRQEQAVEFALPSKDVIPGLLRQILQEASVYTAEIVNRDLETLYFQVRREHQ